MCFNHCGLVNYNVHISLLLCFVFFILIYTYVSEIKSNCNCNLFRGPRAIFAVSRKVQSTLHHRWQFYYILHKDTETNHTKTKTHVSPVETKRLKSQCRTQVTLHRCGRKIPNKCAINQITNQHTSKPGEGIKPRRVRTTKPHHKNNTMKYISFK